VFAIAVAVLVATAFPEGQGRGGGGQGPGAGRAGGGGGLGPAGGRAGRGLVRDNPEASNVGTGAISGRVVVDGSGTPVRRARVTLSGAELGGARSTLTDEQGTFTFQRLPAGRFTMTASKAGLVNGTFGAKRPGRPGTPIQLEDGQQLDKMTISMPRGAVITGVVMDENGEPSAGTTVRALRSVLRTGERGLESAGQDQTDDRGIYRIYQLQPGDYVVSAVPRNMNIGDLREVVAIGVSQLQATIAQGRGVPVTGGIDLSAISSMAGPAAAQLIGQFSQAQTAAGTQPSTGYAPVYYPGTTSPAGASTLTLGIGEERGNVDFQLQLVATARIEGHVVSADGSPLPPATQIALVPAERSGIPGLGLNMTRVDASGRFTFRDVTPGQYSLQARATIRKAGEGAASGGRAFGPGGGGGPFAPVPPGQVAQILWAASDVTVGGQDISGLSLLLQPGMTFSGRIEFLGASTSPSDLTRTRVMLAPRGQQTFEMGGVPPADVDASGRFTFTGVAPGKYSLNAVVPNTPQNAGAGATAGQGRAGGAGPAPGTSRTSWTLKSAIVDGRDVLDFPIEIGTSGAGVPEATLVFTDKTQELSGTIQDGSGRPAPDFTIIVFPTDNRFWIPQARRIASTRPGTDGRYTLRGLPAGDYRMTAVTDVEPGEWYDPAFLNQLQGASIPISLKDGESKVQDVKLAGGN
jgi:hypothetical protein